MSEPETPGLLESDPEGTVPSRCPKCGYTRDPESEECPACGVVFSRFRPQAPEPYRDLAEARPGAVTTGSGAFNPYAPPVAALGSAAQGLESMELADRGARL